MAFFLYLPDGNGLRDRALKVLSPSLQKTSVEIFDSLDEFSLRLRKPHFDVKVMVLFAISSEDLRGFIKLSWLFPDKKLILVLPDVEMETLRMAHKLTPRFITWLDSDLSDLAAVLKRMLERYDYPLQVNDRNI